MLEFYAGGNRSDGNPGSRDAPLRNIQLALNRAAATGISNVYLQAGTYTPGAGLNSGTSNGIYISQNNLSLSGGWDAGFSNRNGYSILDGQNQVGHVLEMCVCICPYFEGLSFVRGNADGGGTSGYGGGIFGDRIYQAVITNCIVASNYAAGTGGGMALVDSWGCRIHLIAISNRSQNGGGIGVENCYAVTVTGQYCNNIGGGGGGIYINGQSKHTSIVGDFFKNAGNNGGGICISGDYTTVTGSTFLSNSSACGAGIALKNPGGYSSISNCIIALNYGAGGVGNAIYSSDHNFCNVLDCILTNNNSANSVIFIQSIGMSIIGCTIGGEDSGIGTGVMESSGYTISTLKDNLFSSTTLNWYFHDSANGDTKNVADLNNAGWLGAGTASGNASY